MIIKPYKPLVGRPRKRAFNMAICRSRVEEPAKSLREIGEIFGITKQRASIILKQNLDEYLKVESAKRDK